MSEHIAIPANRSSFKEFLIKDRINRKILILSAAIIIIQLSIFKYLYPYANYIHDDSFSYLEAAEKNLSINTYLIGYSKFLRLFSVFSNSDLFLTAFQYILIQVSALFFLATLFYFYSPNKVIQMVLVCFLVLNPLFLHLGNLVSSDGLFLGLSLTWFTLLLWIIHRPSRKIIVFHTIILLLCFTVRYNAMIYPVISFIVVYCSKLSCKAKATGILTIIASCGAFVFFTAFEYKKLTGYWQFSPFSGWQLANNAMYAYRYVKKSEREPVHPKYLKLDNMIRQHFDSTTDFKKYPQEGWLASTVYMWEQKLPLFQYRDGLFERDTAASELKKWASMGPYYKSYGIYIITHYPWHYLKYFVWPNANKYYAPPVEFLESYNSWYTQVLDIAQKWFDYKNIDVNTRMKNNRTWVLSFYPILSGVINIVMLFVLFCFAYLKGWKQNRTFGRGVFLAGVFWLLNAGFTIFASSAALRFQSFPIILTTVFSILLIGWMIELVQTFSLESKKLAFGEANELLQLKV